ncbi:hypothetical protein ACFVQ0_02210 [Streptomyces sp. NPDC057900]
MHRVLGTPIDGGLVSLPLEPALLALRRLAVEDRTVRRFRGAEGGA